jgi:zinc/manganese transport system ATP-binding protein
MIRLVDLTLAYDRHPAVHHLSGQFAPGSLTAVIGPNGAGKSTLLKALAGLIRPAEGRIECEGFAPRDIAYLPQQASIDRGFPLSVGDLVVMGDRRNSGLFGAVGQDALQRASDALIGVGLGGFAARSIASLSAGQFQRALFARMMLQDARLILLDEPFAAIDQRTTADLLALLVRWRAQDRTIIAVTHDFDQVRAVFPETLYLARESLGWGPTARILTPENQMRARSMSERWDPEAGICRRDAA